MKVAVCATVRNEAADAAMLVASLRDQSLAADEIVIADGGSTDGTFEALRAAAAGDSRVTLLRAPGTNIAAGRNRAIAVTETSKPALLDCVVKEGYDFSKYE